MRKDTRRQRDTLTLQVRDDEVVVQLQGPVLLHLVLQLKDGLLHVGDLRLLLLQVHALLLQGALLLAQLPLRLFPELPVFPIQLQTQEHVYGVGLNETRAHEERPPRAGPKAYLTESLLQVAEVAVSLLQALL